MVWLATDKSTQSWFLVSVSDDSDPTGTWCNFALQGDRNGSTDSQNWADYEGLGVDNQAVYLTSNQFKFDTDPSVLDYAKIRIIDKTQLYSTVCPAITWTDFWDLRDPNFPSTKVYTVRPAVTFGTPGAEYLMNDSSFGTGTYMTLWSLTNPLNVTPTLTALDVPVTASTAPPDADQLGGSGGTSTCPAPCLIDVGGRRIRNVVYRNGSVWTAHSVAGGTGNAFARARYVRIAVSGPTVLEDVSFGLDNCWLYYPAVTADANSNLVMVYSESCTTSYPGIRYTGRTSTDSGLQASAELKAGEANYLNTGTGKRNRWGDYSGIAIDPANPAMVWIYGEYAASPANTWGTYIGQVTFTPPPPPPILPTATVVLNGAAFRTGQTISYHATLTHGSTPVQVDIYLGALLPDGVTFLSLVQPAPGTITIALGSSPVPFQSNVTLAPLTVPFNFSFTGAEPVGTYFTYAGLAVAGSNPFVPANQLSLGVQGFQFTP